MKRRQLILALLITLLLLPGCWSRREMNDLAPVVGLGFDLTEDGKLEVTISVAQAGAAAAGKGQTGGKGRTKVVLQRSGVTIPEALRLVELSSPRRLILYHNQAIFIGQRLAERGITPIIDFLARDPEVRLTARMALVRGTSMLELFEEKPLTESLQVEAVRKMEANQAGLMEELKDYLVARSRRFQAGIMPVLELSPHPTREEGAPGREMVLTGAAILQHDRVVTYLDRSQVRGAIWLRQKPRRAVVTVACPGHPGEFISARVERGGVRVRSQWDGQRVSFVVLLKGQTYVSDVQCPIDLRDQGTLTAVQQRIGAAVRERVEEVIRRTQATGADPFEFGLMVRAWQLAAWQQVGGERWPQTWAKTQVTVIPDIRIVHVRLLSRRPGNGGGEERQR